MWRSLWVVSLALVSLSSGLSAEEKLSLLPARPKVGEPFQVVLEPLPQAAAVEGQYTWDVTVKDEEQNVITTQPTAAEGPVAPMLSMPPAVAHASYTFKLKIAGPPARELVLLAESGSRTLVATSTTTPPGTAPPREVVPAEPEVAPPAPSPENIELRRMGARLEAAKRWAKQVADLPKSDSLVLPVDFFESALARRPDGSEGILEFAHRPILDAAELHQAMMRAANQFPAETEPERFIEAWHAAREDFLLALPERNAATAFIVELWAEFTDVWERAVLAENPARFREALIQAPLIVTGALLEFDERHIADAMTAGPPAGTRMAPAGTGVYTFGGGYSHAAVHHARVISRIHYRHGRRMARLGY